MVLSIILPVYNIEKYVKRCIHSILDFASPDVLIEVIAINDGSTDNSLNELLSIDDKRLKVLDQSNGGVSAARNRGLLEAKGEYIWLIDPDDYLKDNFIQEVYDILIKNSPELLLFGITWVGEDKIYGTREYPAGEFTVSEVIDMGIYDSNVWSRVIKKELIDSNNIAFIDVVNGEDFDFCIKVFCHTTKVTIPNIIGYNYLIHPDGSSKRRTKEHLEKLASHSVITLGYVKDYLEDSEKKLLVEPGVFEPWFNNYLFGLLYSFFRFNYALPFVEKNINTLRTNGHYPVPTKGLGKKQQLFMFVANRKKLFFTILRLKRLFAGSK